MRERSSEWKDPPCFLGNSGQADCDGVMFLKDMTLTEGSVDMATDLGDTFPIYKSPILEKTWVCNKCGFVFYE